MIQVDNRIFRRSQIKDMTVSNEREFINARAADDKWVILMSACDCKFEGCCLAFADVNDRIGYILPEPGSRTQTARSSSRQTMT